MSRPRAHREGGKMIGFKLGDGALLQAIEEFKKDHPGQFSEVMRECASLYFGVIERESVQAKLAGLASRMAGIDAEKAALNAKMAALDAERASVAVELAGLTSQLGQQPVAVGSEATLRPLGPQPVQPVQAMTAQPVQYVPQAVPVVQPVFQPGPQPVQAIVQPALTEKQQEARDKMLRMFKTHDWRTYPQFNAFMTGPTGEELLHDAGFPKAMTAYDWAMSFDPYGVQAETDAQAEEAVRASESRTDVQASGPQLKAVERMPIKPKELRTGPLSDKEIASRDKLLVMFKHRTWSSFEGFEDWAQGRLNAELIDDARFLTPRAAYDWIVNRSMTPATAHEVSIHTV